MKELSIPHQPDAINVTSMAMLQPISSNDKKLSENKEPRDKSLSC